MSKSPWGNIGAWAAEAEREEAEEREAAAKADAAQPPASFPSLKEAVTTTTKQKKKTKMTLQEFTMQQSTHSGSAPSRGLTAEEMFRLPTGPKERSPDEMQYGTRGFSNYGTRGGSMGPNQGRSQDYEGRRSYGFEDDNRRGGPPHSRVSEQDQPSRADGVDNWASMKRQPQTLPDNSFGHARTGSKYGSLGGGGGPGISSRADEVDNWASVKKPISQPPPQARSSSFGSSFSRPESDSWTRNDPQRLVSDVPKFEPEVVVKVNKPNPFGAARPREDVLAEKGLDWKKLDLDVETKKQQSVSGGSRPTSSHSSRSHSSRPGSVHSSRSEVVGESVVKQIPKVNPFGDAKPREVLLQEKGLDWKKIDLDLQHRRVDRPETEEENNLKEEIENLKKEVLQKSGEEQIGIQELIHKMEHELELLVREFDDKVRYTKKIYERPGSGNGRPIERLPSRPGSYNESRAGFQDRPPSRPGSYDDPRTGYPERPPSRPGAYEDPRNNYNERPRSRPGGYEEARGGFPQRSASMSGGGYQEPRAFDYNERPRSRGTPWTRPSDDRRGVQGGRGFFGSRNVDRSGSRW